MQRIERDALTSFRYCLQTTETILRSINLKVVGSILVPCFLASCTSLPSTNPVYERGKFSLNQDTPGGHFSSWTANHPASEDQISATVKIEDPRPIEKWVPFFAVDLSVSGSREKTARLEFFVSSDGAIHARLKDFGRNSSIALPGTFTLGDSIDIKLNWTGGASIQARTNVNEPRTLELPFTPDTIGLRSGSANVTITDIVVR